MAETEAGSCLHPAPLVEIAPFESMSFSWQWVRCVKPLLHFDYTFRLYLFFGLLEITSKHSYGGKLVASKYRHTGVMRLRALCLKTLRDTAYFYSFILGHSTLHIFFL
jgi:hypothetical protein